MSMENCRAVSVYVAVFVFVISVHKPESMNANVSIYVTEIKVLVKLISRDNESFLQLQKSLF